MTDLGWMVFGRRRLVPESPERISGLLLLQRGLHLSGMPTLCKERIGWGTRGMGIIQRWGRRGSDPQPTDSESVALGQLSYAPKTLQPAAGSPRDFMSFIASISLTVSFTSSVSPL